MRSARRVHRRLWVWLGVCCSLFLAIAAVSAGSRWLTPQSITAFDGEIVNKQALIDAGLSGTPAPGQPSQSVAVDRVLVDGMQTYRAYCCVAHGSCRL